MRRSTPLALSAVTLLLVQCGSSGTRSAAVVGGSGQGATSSGAASGSGASTGAQGSDASAGGSTIGPSGLPTPPGSGNVAQPSGPPGGLTVLDWAGFTAATTFTFDDSQPSQIEHYADLEAVGVPMTFYVSTANSGEADYDATWTQAIADGNEIGNHTVHHCQSNLTGCSFGTPFATLEDELDQATSYIESHYTAQSDVWTGASPFGDTGYDADAQSRFFVYRGVGGGTIGPNDDTDPFDLPIHLAATGETAATFESNIGAAHSAGRWLIILVHTINPTEASNEWYNPVNVTDVTASMSYAKGLGDDWVDTLAAVGAYWRGQKILSAVTPTTSGDTSTYTWTLPPHFPPGKYLRVSVTGGTLTQNGQALQWSAHGYYEVSLDVGSLTIGP